MSMHSPTEAESFYQFLGQSLTQGGRETPPESLLRTWRERQEFEETCAAIQEGMDDIAAGRCQSLEEFDGSFRERNGLPPRKA